jgi:transposase
VESMEATQRQIVSRLQKERLLVKRVKLLKSIGGGGKITALDSSAGKQHRGPLSKQRNAHLQTVLIEAAKLAPRWNPKLAELHARELARGSNRNRATLEVARKLVAYLLAVERWASRSRYVCGQKRRRR